MMNRPLNPTGPYDEPPEGTMICDGCDQPTDEMDGDDTPDDLWLCEDCRPSCPVCGNVGWEAPPGTDDVSRCPACNPERNYR